MSSLAVKLFRPILKKVGFSITRYPVQSTRDFMRLLKFHQIDLVIDVGANTGQFGEWLIDFGYSANILSFEPMQKEYDVLLRTSSAYKNWAVAEKSGLSNIEGEQVFNISENSVSSSFLPLTEYVQKVSPSTRYVATEKVKIHRLENYDYQDIIANSKFVFLKMDVQGLEDKVLEGSKGIMSKVKGLLVEMSLMPLYEGQVTMLDLLSMIDSLGYAPYYFIPHVTTDVSGRLLQVDGIFFKKDLA